jgi:hypothetical protein
MITTGIFAIPHHYTSGIFAIPSYTAGIFAIPSYSAHVLVLPSPSLSFEAIIQGEGKKKSVKMPNAMRNRKCDGMQHETPDTKNHKTTKGNFETTVRQVNFWRLRNEKNGKIHFSFKNEKRSWVFDKALVTMAHALTLPNQIMRDELLRTLMLKWDSVIVLIMKIMRNDLLRE